MRCAATVAAATVLLLVGCSAADDPDPGTEGTGGTGGEVVEVPGVVVDGDSAALSPDGSRVAVPCDGSICVWTTADGALADTFDGGGVVAWSPDGGTIATDRVEDGVVSVLLLDARTGREEGAHGAYTSGEVQDGPGGGLLDVAFAPDGAFVAGVGADGLVRLFSLTDPSEVVALDPPGDAPVAVAWSPDGARIAVASSDAPTTILDADSGEQLAVLGGAPQGDVAWSPDGTVVATASFASDDPATTIWDAGSGDVEATLPRAGYRLAFRGRDALVLSQKNERGVLVWTWAADDVITLDGATDDPRAVLVAPDASRVIAVSPRDGVLAWAAGGGGPTTFDRPTSG